MLIWLNADAAIEIHMQPSVVDDFLIGNIEGLLSCNN
jgi:hypothetical protein